jgi:uncharacterized protein with von Willebrand factor type A (vWA) domain
MSSNPDRGPQTGDLAALVARFAALLRSRGVVVTPAQQIRLVEAAVRLPLTVSDVYWAARLTLLAEHDDIAVFDRVFAEVFRNSHDLADVVRGDPHAPPTPAGNRNREPRARVASAPTPVASMPAVLAAATDGAAGQGGRLLPVATVASDVDRLASIDFGELKPGELAAVVALVRQLRARPPLRRGRRTHRHPHGDRLDLRATLRRSPRTGGDPVRLVTRHRTVRRRRLIVLCDISGSMEPYARAYVQFLHATSGTVQAEVFTFATRLTRLTRVLAGSREPQRAMAKAAQTAPDWRGGTRIGPAIKDFLDHYGRRGLARGAVVVILSDGWERGDPALLEEQMARLHRLAHKIVWVNPRSADRDYAPLAGGMAVALPYCDAFLSGHDLTAFEHVLDAIGSMGRPV